MFEVIRKRDLINLNVFCFGHFISFTNMVEEQFNEDRSTFDSEDLVSKQSGRLGLREINTSFSIEVRIF